MSQALRPRDWRLSAIVLLVSLPGLASLVIGLFLVPPGYVLLVLRDPVFGLPLAERRMVIGLDGQEVAVRPRSLDTGVAVALGPMAAGPHRLQWTVAGYDRGERGITVESMVKVPQTRVEALLRPDFGQVELQTVDAVTNRPLPVPVAAAVADVQGKSSGSTVIFHEVPRGTHPIKASATGYCPESGSVTVAAGEIAKPSLVLVPTIGADEAVRCVLQWNKGPDDIDAHLHIRLDDESSDRNIFFKAKETKKGDRLVAGLDIDMLHPGGMETITIKKGFPGQYRYAVENFSVLHARATHQPLPPNLAASEAQVRVYVSGDCTPHVYSVPTGCDETEWVVVDMTVDAAGVVTFRPENRCVQAQSGQKVTK